MRSFKIYGIWPQTDIHTTSANAVTLVWGSVRLTPTTLRVQIPYTLETHGTAITYSSLQFPVVDLMTGCQYSII